MQKYKVTWFNSDVPEVPEAHANQVGGKDDEWVQFTDGIGSVAMIRAPKVLRIDRWTNRSTCRPNRYDHGRGDSGFRPTGPVGGPPTYP